MKHFEAKKTIMDCHKRPFFFGFVYLKENMRVETLPRRIFQSLAMLNNARQLHNGLSEEHKKHINYPDVHRFSKLFPFNKKHLEQPF